MTRKIAIIGGGISGITSAIELAKDKNNEIHIFEKRNYVLKGPPYCHLHAGGILYPEISLDDAKRLLHDSLLFANRFKDCLEYRPTIVAYNKQSKYKPDDLLKKCHELKQEYISSSYNTILCNSSIYYAIYTRDDVEYYKKYDKLKENLNPDRLYHDKYVVNFCKLLNNIDDIQYPFVSIFEPGINQVKVEHQLIKELESHMNIIIHVNTTVNSLEDLKPFCCIINASGKNLYSTLKHNKSQEKYEFKSSWLLNLPLKIKNFPEIAIIGERETSNGMLQVTPLNMNTFQVHCMTPRSTIIQTFDRYPNTYPILQKDDIYNRGSYAIREIGKYFPVFMMSNVQGACPGLQRIPYSSKSKRISYLDYFSKNNTLYVDMFTLKACSTISLTNELCKLV